MSPAEFCHDKVVKSKSNFTIAFALLNGEKREAMETLYAYCREIDDIADSCLDLYPPLLSFLERIVACEWPRCQQG